MLTSSERPPCSVSKSQMVLVMMSRPLIARTPYLWDCLIKGENIPCIPSLVPVVQLAQPGKLFGRIVDRRGADDPSLINRASTGNWPALTIGAIMSKVAPSNPIIAVFIGLLLRKTADCRSVIEQRPPVHALGRGQTH